MKLLRPALLCLPLGACTPDPEVREVSPVAATLDPSLADGFWAFPFPADSRRTAAGTPDLAGFPNPGASKLIDDYLTWGMAEVDGFGLSAPIWLPFDGAVAMPEQSAAGIADAMGCAGPIRLMDVDPDSPEYGTCRPLRWLWIDEVLSDPFLPANVLALAPAWGFPLRSGTTYAAWVSEVQDGAGGWLQGPPALRSALAGEGALAELYAPLRAALTQDPALLPSDGDRAWIAAATVFTTQDVHAQMDALADAVRADPALPRWDGDLLELPEGDARYRNDYAAWQGSYVAANFQRGELPYRSEGGGFEWIDGQPVVQQEETIPFFLGEPQDVFTMPKNGWPVVIQSHGTFGDEFSHFSGSSFVPASLLARRGFLSIGIPQPIHGERWPERTSLAQQLYAFNYFNPESGTSMFRQSAIDTIALVELLRREFTEGGAVATAAPRLRIDPERIYYVGHSQGGITGAIAIPYDEHIRGWVLSGAGGGLSMTVLQRTDPLDIQDLIVTALQAGEEVSLYELHPVIGLVQMLVERTDPLNHAPAWFEGRPPTSVLLTEGLNDAQTPADVTEAMAVAAGLSPMEGYVERPVAGLAWRGLPALDPPFRGNRATDGGDVTAALAQFDSDHFAIFREEAAAAVYANFLWSAERDDDLPEAGATFP